MAPQFENELWQLLALVVVVLGPPPVMTIVAGGVTGLLVRGASIGRGLFIGLVLGGIASAAGFGALVAALVLFNGFADEWVPFMLPIVATGVVFAAAAALLTWRMRERPSLSSL